MSNSWRPLKKANTGRRLNTTATSAFCRDSCSADENKSLSQTPKRQSRPMCVLHSPSLTDAENSALLLHYLGDLDYALFADCYSEYRNRPVLPAFATAGCNIVSRCNLICTMQTKRALSLCSHVEESRLLLVVPEPTSAAAWLDVLEVRTATELRNPATVCLARRRDGCPPSPHPSRRSFVVSGQTTRLFI